MLNGEAITGVPVVGVGTIGVGIVAGAIVTVGIPIGDGIIGALVVGAVLGSNIGVALGCLRTGTVVDGGQVGISSVFEPPFPDFVFDFVVCLLLIGEAKGIGADAGVVTGGRPIGRGGDMTVGVTVANIGVKVAGFTIGMVSDGEQVGLFSSFIPLDSVLRMLQ
jgi:hypothetical protein